LIKLIIDSLYAIAKDSSLLPSLTTAKALRYDLRASIFENFHGGHAPRPLERAGLTC